MEGQIFSYISLRSGTNLPYGTDTNQLRNLRQWKLWKNPMKTLICPQKRFNEIENCRIFEQTHKHLNKQTQTHTNERASPRLNCQSIQFKKIAAPTKLSTERF